MWHFSPADRNFMARAIQLARRGMNTTSPNPRVGCVIVSSDGETVGEGWHVRAGEGHAEVNALAHAGDRARDATVYVTLEPCSHTGKTGPCSQALIEAGVSEVVFAMEDPNPAVSGQGITMLRDAGIDVRGPLMEEEARELNPGFIKRMTRRLPWVQIKTAASLDGRTAMANGESKWITSPRAREDVQRLRARSCAIVTGVESVLRDDPALTVRLYDGARQPLRVIVDSQLRLPAGASILEQPGRTVVACVTEPGTRLDGVDDYWVLPAHEGRVDLAALLRKLADEQCNEVLVETGATLAGAFVGRGLVDEMTIYMAAKLMGSRARPMFELPINKMSAQLPLSVRDIRAIGDDFRITVRPDPEG